MEKQNNTPRLRFPEFTGDWVEKSFGELYQKNNVKNDLSFGVDKIISVANMYYKSDAVVGDEDYLRSYNIFRIGDIAYEGNKSANYAYGRFVENTIGDGIVSHVFDVYSPISPDHCIDYWKYAINYEGIMRPILEKSTIKSTMMTNLIARDFLKQKILVPPTLAEQKKIASILMEIDAMISAQGQKVDALKEKKNGLMQQLFPQDGETTPRFRFPGFTGEWYDKALSECLEERNEQFPESEDYPLMAFVAGVGITPKGEKYDRSALVKDAANKKYKRTELGDFIYSSNNLESGSIGFNKYGSACISPVYSIFKSKSNIDSTFIGILLTKKSFIAQMVKFRQGVVYGQWKIPEKEFLKIHIFIPSPKEQQKIASCLSELDNLIASESAKLEALKEHKKGLMQNLFPQPAK